MFWSFQIEECLKYDNWPLDGEALCTLLHHKLVGAKIYSTKKFICYDCYGYSKSICIKSYTNKY